MGKGWGRLAWVAVALVLSLPLQATEKRSFSKTSSAPDPDALTWPLPWKPGMVLVYDQRYVSEESKDEHAVRVTSTDVVELRMAKRDGGGWLQRWTGRDPQMQVEGMPPQMQRVMTAAVESFRDLPVDIALNAEGHFENVANLPEVQPRFRRVLQGMFDGMLAEAKGKPGADDAEVMFARLVDAMTAPAVLESQLGETPASYNFVSRGGLVVDRRYDYEDEYANPLDGEMIASTNSLLLTRAPDDATQVDLRWTVRPDLDGITGVIARFVDRTMQGQAPDEKQRAALVATLRDGAEFVTEVTYRVDPVSGIVQRMELVQRTRFGGKRETERTTMVLRR
jgi:hypothetical protein